MALRVEMVSRFIQMGTAICRYHLCRPGKLSIGRGRKAVTGGDGLRDFYRHRDCRNSNHRNGLFSRKHESRSRLLVSSDRRGTDRSASFFGHYGVSPRSARTLDELMRIDECICGWCETLDPRLHPPGLVRRIASGDVTACIRRQPDLSLPRRPSLRNVSDRGDRQAPPASALQHG